MDNRDVLLEEASPIVHTRKWMPIEGFNILWLISVNVDRSFFLNK
jgi:hypothetical protein